MRILNVEFGSGVEGEVTRTILFSVPDNVDLEYVAKSLNKAIKKKGFEKNGSVVQISGLEINYSVEPWIEQLLNSFNIKKLTPATIRVQYESYISQGNLECRIE